MAQIKFKFRCSLDIVAMSMSVIVDKIVVYFTIYRLSVIIEHETINYFFSHW